MLALSDRTYDLLGPCWYSEHFHTGPSARGLEAHRNSVRWVSVNHLHGITGLEQLDAALFQQLTK